MVNKDKNVGAWLNVEGEEPFHGHTGTTTKMSFFINKILFIITKKLGINT